MTWLSSFWAPTSRKIESHWLQTQLTKKWLKLTNKKTLTAEEKNQRLCGPKVALANKMSEVRKPADDFDDEDDDDIFRAAFSTQKNGAKVKIENDDAKTSANDDSLSKYF